MTPLVSQVRPDSPAFLQNRADMLAAVDELRRIEAKVRVTEEAAREKFVRRGSQLPRDRLAHLLDRGSPFLELSTLCGYRYHDDTDGSLAGGNSIVGLGFVSHTRCMIVVNNAAIKGGTISPWGLEKILRAQTLALENRLPLVTLAESGGANLLYQQEVFVRGGQSFYNQARLSAAGVPQITVVHGSSTAGGAYLPGLSDHVIMVHGRAKVFLAGPPLLRAATGELATDEALGGAQMHAAQAGTCERMATDDADAIRLAREVVAQLGWAMHGAPPPRAPEPPNYDVDDLCGAVPVDYRKAYDCREVVARLFDGSRFLEMKPDYDPYTVCGYAHLDGWPVGVVGNNGPITVAGATKAAHFIQACCQAGIPIVYLQNTTGFMVGAASEQGGIIKHGSKMIQAVANAAVPQISLLIGASFGAGNYGMCGRGFAPRFIFAWPNSRTAVMGGEQAAQVMALVAAEKSARAGAAVDTASLEPMRQQILETFEQQSHAFNCSARLFDDGVIDPRDSRRVLSLTLATCRDAAARVLRPSTYGVARM
jgi:geranyl-CoA carboxylase beta subunit